MMKSTRIDSPQPPNRKWWNGCKFHWSLCRAKDLFSDQYIWFSSRMKSVEFLVIRTQFRLCHIWQLFSVVFLLFLQSLNDESPLDIALNCYLCFICAHWPGYFFLSQATKDHIVICFEKKFNSLIVGSNIALQPGDHLGSSDSFHTIY